MNIIRKFIVALIMITTVVNVAQAHPGHGSDGSAYSVLHFFTEPVHYGLGLIIAIVGGIAYLQIRKALKKQPIKIQNKKRR